MQDLDAFLSRLYHYHREHGFLCTVVSRVLNLLTLLFTVLFTTSLLIVVDWDALVTQCRSGSRECDVASVGIRSRPFAEASRLRAFCVGLYIAVFAVACLWTLCRFLLELPQLLDIRAFCARTLALCDADVRVISWTQLLGRLVASQSFTRLCVWKDLDEHDICSRILRRDNYLVAMLNKDVLKLELGGRVWLTQSLLWNLHWGILHALFDTQCRLRRDIADEAAFVRRLRLLAVVNLLLSPFLVVWMVLYLFLRNAERIYHHPSSVGARSWSTEARWRFRELCELPHLLEARLAAAHQPAAAYCASNPSHVLSTVGRFVAFVTGAFAAALLALAAVDERLLEAVLWGRNLIWYTAVCGALLAASRALIVDDDPSSRPPQPAEAMRAVVASTHYLPRRWRNREHTRSVQAEFCRLFPLHAGALANELLGILFVTPWLLWSVLPACAGDIVAFLRENTVNLEGVGDVCTMAAFDFARHGNRRYGSQADAPSRSLRSHQGKLEKSFLSFHSVYEDWQPDAQGQAFLSSLVHAQGDAQSAHPGASAVRSLSKSEHLQTLLQSQYVERRGADDSNERGRSGRSTQAST